MRRRLLTWQHGSPRSGMRKSGGRARPPLSHAIDHDHLGWASIDWNGIENERLGQLCAPMYALARIAADRKILELHGVAWNAEVCTVCHHPHEDGETLDNDAWPCATVRLLASPYKGREGWQEAWAHE